MVDLPAALADYLELRRALGFALRREEKLLSQFLAYLRDHDTDTVTVEHALAWAGLPVDAGAAWRAARMAAVRGFAAYLHALDPRAQVPPRGLLSAKRPRAVPFLYTETDLNALLRQAGRLPTPMHRARMQTLIALMAVTGMRGGEVVALDDDDFDPEDGVLLVRHGKLGAHRLLPLHPSTTEALTHYQRQRDIAFPRPVSRALLVSTAGTRLNRINVGQTITRLARSAGLRARSARCRPRPHDLRHSFAVNTLIDWYRDGGDVPARLPLLSAYLGHREPANTYWYLHAAPELMAQAAHRLEAAHGERS